MIHVDLKALLLRLDGFCATALQNAAGLCVSRTHYEVAVEHFLLKCLESPRSDIPLILARFEVNPGALTAALNASLEEARSGNAGKPVFSPLLTDLFADAWLVSSVDMGLARIRSGAVLLALAERPAAYASGAYADLLKPINRDILRGEFARIVASSEEQAAPATEAAPTGAPGREGETFLARFCQDFTATARAGKIDPVFGRDDEIRQAVDILARRRKNNPILVGEPGVGKTAIVEGLALRIVEEDVPEMLRGVTLMGLDMGALEAGAGMKGEFENRLRGVINEIKASEKPIILFIDEAHTLIGAGGTAGGGDAANLLKPALARGELRTLAATTWSEYKKYFEKDPALARRFQLIKLAEPSARVAAMILQGLRASYEKAHQVLVRSDAIEACATLADRYITGRFLPDKAIDLLDTSCARVKINLSAKPAPVEDLERAIQALGRERAALDRDRENGSPVDEDRATAITAGLADKKAALEALTARWQKELDAAKAVLAAREALGQADPQKPEDKQAAAAALEAAGQGLAAARDGAGLIQIEVTPDVVSQVVADWTGIPLGKLMRAQTRTVLDLEGLLRERIKGQDQALGVIATEIKAAKAGIKDPGQPQGVFLLVGPSGVGKTETALVLADLLFGGEKNAISINMSEFKESHTVSRLIGSPPGYVGYGEGGRLTEAVRQKPYSVVLLDEVEKAHLNVMELFYQVFDKGVLADGEGKEINFKNTVMMLTSNLASDVLQEMTKDGAVPPAEALEAAIRPILSEHFKPALLARMRIVPYASLPPSVLAAISRLKLARLADTILANNKMRLAFDDKVAETIAARCTEVETGARNIQAILDENVLPRLSQTILESLARGDMPQHCRVGVGPDGEFTVGFDAPGEAPGPDAGPASTSGPDATGPDTAPAPPGSDTATAPDTPAADTVAGAAPGAPTDPAAQAPASPDKPAPVDPAGPGAGGGPGDAPTGTGPTADKG
ncbi:MAG: type VI secretion system ATPase TssH [Solidesulfovibrio sp. DCME]|uniref:type VI secretion system ATPase TssH n=1 Tax=Solidesulfovibrio sp. DCME TaxID=3447380 RepID=UPI003D0F8949